jgi:hypothetical protein
MKALARATRYFDRRRASEGVGLGLSLGFHAAESAGPRGVLEA